MAEVNQVEEVSDERLGAMLASYLAIHSEILNSREQQKDILAEAKDIGLDPKMFRQITKIYDKSIDSIEDELQETNDEILKYVRAYKAVSGI